MNKKKRKKIIIGIFVLEAICLSVIVIYLLKYKKEKEEYIQISEEETFIVGVRPEITDDTKKNIIGFGEVRTESGENTIEYEDYYDSNVDYTYDTLRVDYYTLKAYNNDYVCWIHMLDGTSYPVVKSEKTTDYLHKSFEGKKSSSGCIMMESANAADLSDYNTIIYGHNMNNGTMFGKNYKYANMEHALSNMFFYIHTKNGYYTYQIFSAQQTTDQSYVYNLIYDPQTFMEYLDKVKQDSYYWFAGNEELKDTDRIVTLSCCKGRPGGKIRMIIRGKRICYTSYDGIRNWLD